MLIPFGNLLQGSRSVAFAVWTNDVEKAGKTVDNLWSNRSSDLGKLAQIIWRWPWTPVLNGNKDGVDAIRINSSVIRDGWLKYQRQAPPHRWRGVEPVV